MANQIHSVSLEIFAVYNRVVRTPTNWQKERARLKKNPNSRAIWTYQVPDSIRKLKEQIINLRGQFNDIKENKSTIDIYQVFLQDVVEATVQTALVECKILEDLKNDSFKTTLELRRQFYVLDYDYSNVESLYSELLNDLTIKKTGEEFGEEATSANEAAKIVRGLIKNVRKKIEEVIPLPPQYREQILEVFNAEVMVVDEPSFRMRCITDPKTLTTKVLLNKNLRYSLSYLKIAYLHEFCGHALEMAVFDKTLVKKHTLPEIYSYAGVSSPNIFDVKSEVFADLIVTPFIEMEERRYVVYRRNVWLVCRAMADYLYHIQGRTIKEVMKIYETVGLGDFAFDEAVMASIFIDGYQGMYLFANQELERLQEENNLSDQHFLTLLLYMGKVPIKRFKDFTRAFDLMNPLV